MVTFLQIARIERYLEQQIDQRLRQLNSDRSEEDIANGVMYTTEDIMEWAKAGKEIDQLKENLGMSNFECVAQYNEIIGNEAMTPEHPEYWTLLERQLELIQEELKETQEAIRNRDLTELRDGICDVLVTTYGLAHRSGFDADLDMTVVHDSNMSKFCDNLEDAEASVAHYAEQGLEAEVVESNGLYAIVSSKDQEDVNGKRCPAGKNLKGIHFFEPSFE